MGEGRSSLRGHFCATTDGITSTDYSFPDGEFFPDIDDMVDDVGVNVNLKANLKVNVNLNANVNPPAASYAICSYLFQFLLRFLVLAFGIDVTCLSWLDMICSSILLVYMIRLISTITVILYY
jgi:hypothetical protein